MTDLDLQPPAKRAMEGEGDMRRDGNHYNFESGNSWSSASNGPYCEPPPAAPSKDSLSMLEQLVTSTKGQNQSLKVQMLGKELADAKCDLYPGFSQEIESPQPSSQGPAFQGPGLRVPGTDNSRGSGPSMDYPYGEKGQMGFYPPEGYMAGQHNPNHFPSHSMSQSQQYPGNYPPGYPGQGGFQGQMGSQQEGGSFYGNMQGSGPYPGEGFYPPNNGSHLQQYGYKGPEPKPAKKSRGKKRPAPETCTSSESPPTHPMTSPSQVDTYKPSYTQASAASNSYTLQDLSSSNSLADRLLHVEKMLSMALATLRFADPVKYIYDPLQYAWEPHCRFVEKYCKSQKKVLFLGMNPGPHGMAQTGIPFGEISVVTDWLKIEGTVHKPVVECPKREILGFDCKRSEITGARFWSLFKELCQSPEVFFNNCFVYNICPILFMKETGKNITPADLKVNDRRMLSEVCDKALGDVLRLLGVEYVIGIGKYAEERATEVVNNQQLDGIKVMSIMHPSPANPSANKGWNGIAQQQLKDMGVLSLIVDVKA